ncbi:MAG: mismatch-specific DNA-glycosylase [Acidobacteriia bacterium]|nr:mismatch-specific DNA-glycosylase [Terriglobia bacterium]
MHRELPDYLRPGLKVVFVGINPGELSARAGHYYANPRNAFWDCLYKSGLTNVKLAPIDDKKITEFDLGLTDRVKRWTRSANELKISDFRRGAEELRQRLDGRWPRVVAFNGKKGLEWILGYHPDLGPQPQRFGESRVFVLPSTSPANAVLPRPRKVAYFRALARWLEVDG